MRSQDTLLPSAKELQDTMYTGEGHAHLQLSLCCGTRAPLLVVRMLFVARWKIARVARVHGGSLAQLC